MTKKPSKEQLEDPKSRKKAQEEDGEAGEEPATRVSIATEHEASPAATNAEIDPPMPHEGSRDPSPTEESICSPSSDAGEQPASKRPRLVATPTDLTHCSACLDILSDVFVQRLSEAVVEELQAAGYEGLRSFSLSLSTPLSLMARQVAIRLHLSERREILNFQAPIESYVKEALRRCLYSQLEVQLAPVTSAVESPFQVVVQLDHSHSGMECSLVAEAWPDVFYHKRRWRRGRRWQGKQPAGEGGRGGGKEWNINTVTLNKALSSATTETFPNTFPLTVQEPCSFCISFHHSSIFIGGRYCKYSRDLPQTPWVVDGVRKVETSVQELICNHIQRFVRSSEIKFSSSGREDCDVRMLGNGRPFLVELLNPRKTVLEEEEVRELERDINDSTELVGVRHLTIVSKQHTAAIKEGEEEKKKLYSALVWAPEGVTEADMERLGEMKAVVLRQKTPIRVIHRRSLATRERTVHHMSSELFDPHHFTLHLSTQAGTYVKEFVHGDFGRTQPSLRSILGQEVDILTLDVQEVSLEWPPQLGE